MPDETQETNPLQPLGGTATVPSPTASPAPATPETANEVDTSQVEPPSVNAAAGQQAIGSPLAKQHRDLRGNNPDHFPLQVVFLDGTLKGLALDLGLATNELSMNQAANWGEGEEEGLRQSLNYRQASSRDVSFKLEYYDINASILHLTENVHHLQEVDPTLGRPPFLMLIMGQNATEPWVCTNLRTQLLDPQAKRRGYHHGTVDVEFKLVGGRDSEHALSKPLVATPLGDIRAAQTELERQRQGEQQVARLLLAECLGEEGSDAIVDLMEEEKLNDPAAIAQLSPQAFTQAAIAGFFTKETLQNQAVLDKLVRDLATSMAQSENGVAGQPIGVQQAFANAILTGDTSGLQPSLGQQAIITQADYQGILEAIATQDYSKILDTPTTAGNKLRQFGACGLSMRQVAQATQAGQGGEAQGLQTINSFLVTPDLTDQQIIEKFGDLSKEQLGALRNGAPYQSKAEFLTHMSQNARGIDGYALWSAGAAQPEPPKEEGEDSEDQT